MSKNKVDIVGIDTKKLLRLNEEEMVNLFKSFQNGNKNSKDKLVEGNLRLVLSILKRYQNKVDNMDDLFQIGCVGLIKAIDNFDLSFNVKFSTYAVFMIEGEIKRYIRDSNQVRISRSIRELAYSIINYKEEFLNNFSRYPTNDEICLDLKITPYDLSSALQCLIEPISIFEPIYNDGGDTIYLLDQIEDKKNISIDESISLKKAIENLSDKERDIIIKRYFLGVPQTEIASILGISQAQVSRLENSALNNVRKLIR